MKAEDVAILIILVLGVGLIGILAMPMFDKIPRSDDTATNSTVNNLTVPLTNVAGKGFTAFDIGLIIAAIIGAFIVVYKTVYKK
jgi:hypothetical protein